MSRLSARLVCEPLELRDVPAVLLGLSANNLLRFDSSNPGAIQSQTVITGLAAGGVEQLIGIDYRPADGLLYGVTFDTTTSASRLVTINTATGTATAVATLTADPTDTTNPFTALSGSGFGLDFNPMADRIRVVSNTDQNLRINPTNGQVTTDGDINPSAPTVVAPAVVGSAYSNDFAGATATTLYGLTDVGNRLVVQDPNTGTLTTVGTVMTLAGSPLEVTAGSSFDIVTTGGPGGRVDTAYATLTDPSTFFEGLYSIDLSTGTATALGGFNPNTPRLDGLAVIPTGTLNFSASNDAVTEGAGTVTITVTRTGGSLGEVSVNYSTADGTATAGSDYTAPPAGSGVVFASGDTTPKTLTIPIAADATAESPETFTVSLSNATAGAVVGATNTATVTISDAAASPGQLNFSASNYAVSENAGAVTVTVTRTGGTSGAVSVSYATGDATGTGITPATAGSDYTATAGTLTFADGVASQSFMVPIALDATAEPPETFVVALTSPTGGATIGNTPVATVTISDVAAPTPPAAPAPAPAAPPSAERIATALIDSLLGPAADVIIQRALGASGFSPADFRATATGFLSGTGPVLGLDGVIDARPRVVILADLLYRLGPLGALDPKAVRPLLNNDVVTGQVVQGLFNGFLGRDATAAEQTLFVAFLRSTGDLRTAVLVLVGSGE